MSSSNDGNDGNNRPFRRVQTTNLLVNDSNMSSLSDLLDVFLRIRHGIDQQEVIMISESQLETFGPFIAQQLANLAIMTAHHPDDDDDSSEDDEEENEAETNPAKTEAEADEPPEPEGRDDDEQNIEKDERVVKI